MRRLPGVQPSRGCTEPAAISLAAALAARIAGADPKRVEVRCDRATFKNALAAAVPGTGGLRGPWLAAALGAIAGEPARGLEVLAGVGREDVLLARGLIDAGRVTVSLEPQRWGRPRLYVEARVEGVALGRAVLADAHDRVAALERDGIPCEGGPVPASQDDDQREPAGAGPTFSAALDLAAALGSGEDAQLLLEALRANLEASSAPPTPSAANPADWAEEVAGRGALARMQGQPVTIWTSGFSGNQGLVATIPVWATAHAVGADEATLAYALAVSHAVGSYVRSCTGVLSPLCNAVHAAGAGAAAACALLFGGDENAAELAGKLVLATSGGTLCDGAKPSCSLKVELAAGQAVRIAQRVVAGRGLVTSDGLAGVTLGETASNLGRLAYPALEAADAEVLRIVSEKDVGAPRPPIGHH